MRVSKYLSLLTVCFFTVSPSTQAAGSKNVLFLGDSLSAGKHGIGYDFQVSTDARLKVAALCGASPHTYSGKQSRAYSHCGGTDTTFLRSENGQRVTRPKTRAPALSDLLKFGSGSHKADAVVVQLGTNLFGEFFSRGGGTASIQAEVKTLAKKIFSQGGPETKIVWVAPPQILKYDGKRVSELMKEKMLSSIQAVAAEYNTDKKRFLVIDGRKFTKTAPLEHTDGTHYPPGGTHDLRIETEQMVNQVLEDPSATVAVEGTTGAEDSI